MFDLCLIRQITVSDLARTWDGELAAEERLLEPPGRPKRAEVVACAVVQITQHDHIAYT